MEGLSWNSPCNPPLQKFDLHTRGMFNYNSAMHEWALAEAVIETVKKEIQGRRVSSIESLVLTFGELQNIDVTIFKEGLKNFNSDDLPLSSEAVVIEKEPVGFSCGPCGKTWNLADVPDLTEDDLESIHFLPESAYTFISCPVCGSPDFLIITGRGVSIKSIDLIEEEGRNG